MKLELQFGSVVPSVSEQLKKQLNYIDDTTRRFDKTANAITEAYLGNVITESEKMKARRRLIKKITKYLNSIPLKEG